MLLPPGTVALAPTLLHVLVNLSQQCCCFVNLSFIKQYYEMMAKHPENLHKFYNEDSHFLHSDLNHVRFNPFTYDVYSMVDVMFRHNASV